MSWGERVMISAVVGVVLVIAMMIGWAIQHPCLRREMRDTECGGALFCSYFDPQTGLCMEWVTTQTYPCRVMVCVERAQ